MSQAYRAWFCLDENGDVMRVVKHKEEALALIAIRDGWTLQCKTITPKQT